MRTTNFRQPVIKEITGSLQVNLTKALTVSPKAAEKLTITVYGEDMAPHHKPGDLISCKAVDLTTFIQYGETYVVETSQGKLLRKLMPNEDPELINLTVSSNQFPVITIPISEIKRAWIVAGSIRKY